ncbi:MAG: hypothetical protein ACP5LG_03270, partial [Conexivisphaera sp.]
KEWFHKINESSPLNVTVMGPGGSFNFSGGVPPIGQGRGPSNGSGGMFQGGMGSSGGMTGNSSSGFGMTQGVAFADEDEGFGLQGYTLAPGQSATFVYSGVIALGPHLEDSPIGSINITLAPIAGQSYSVRVMSIPATNATTTVTAG